VFDAAAGRASLGFLARLSLILSSPAIEETGEVAKVSAGLAFSDSSVPSGRARLPLFLNLFSKFIFLFIFSSCLDLSTSDFFARWKRSKNDPSLVNTLEAFDFGFWTRLGVPVR